MNKLRRYKATSAAGFVVALCIIVAIAVTVHIENDCREQGGFVKWIYSSKTTNYLCISKKDGRILG